MSKTLLQAGIRIVAYGSISMFFLCVSLTPKAYAATFTVNTLLGDDDGVCDVDCTLQDAIGEANANLGADVIEFSVAGTITLTDSIPIITEALTIDGASAGVGAGPHIVIDGAGDANTIMFDVRASNVSFYGLNLQNAGSDLGGVAISTANSGGISNLIVGGAELGQEMIFDSNTSGNVAITDVTTASVVNSIFGPTDATGQGVAIATSSNVTIGGVSASARNVFQDVSGAISINAATGVDIYGNYFGTDSTGGVAGDITGSGISVTDTLGASTDLNIGGATTDHGNIFGNAGQHGINFVDTGAGFSEVLVQNNIFGTGIVGDELFPIVENCIGLDNVTTASILGNTVLNCGTGIQLVDGSGVTIGTSTLADRNVIGSSTIGISIIDTTTISIENNHIGVDAAGTGALPNTSDGILLSGVSDVNIYSNQIVNNGTSGLRAIAASTAVNIGSADASHANIISGNATGLSLTNTNNVTVLGNKIGVESDGLTTFANTGRGIFISGTSSSIVIGGSTSTERNIISGNGTNGIDISGNFDDSTIENNYIGVDSTGNVSVSNDEGGIVMDLTAGTNNSILNNVVASNGGVGISVDNDGTDNSFVYGNLIGVGADGTTELGNTGNSLVISDAILVGDANDDTRRNIIVGSGSSGVSINGDSNVVQNNYIGVLADGVSTYSNGQFSFSISNSAANNIIGGIVGNEKNLLFSDSTPNTSVNGHFFLNNVGTGNTIRGNEYLGDIEEPIVPFGGIVLRYIGHPVPPLSVDADILPAPTISSVSNTTVAGTGATASATMDYYFNGNYLGSSVADGSGAFSFSADFSGSKAVLVTYTNGSGTTSESTLKFYPVDTDGDGIVDVTEDDAGTNSADATDNDTVSEQAQTIFDAADTTADGYPAYEDLINDGTGAALLSNVLEESTSDYEEAIADPSSVGLSYASPTAPTRTELQAVIDAVNRVTDTDSDGIADATEMEAGTNYNLATDADTIAEQVQIIFDAASAVADGTPTAEDLANTLATNGGGQPLLDNVEEDLIDLYETGIEDPTSVGEDAYATPGSPTQAELQAVIDAVNLANTPLFTVTQSGGTTVLTEETTDSFTVVLSNMQPSSNVVFNVTSSDTGAATVSPSTLTFTTLNWDTPQTVTVTGVTDADTDNESVTVTISVNDAGSDDDFDVLADQTVTATITDTTEESAPTGGSGSGGGSRPPQTEEELEEEEEETPVLEEEPLLIDAPEILDTLVQELDQNILGDEFTLEEGRRYGYPIGAFDPVSDEDMDGLPYFDEVVMLTSEDNADTDGDGIADGLEVLTGTDPLSANSFKVDAMDITLECADGQGFTDTLSHFAETAICILQEQGIVQGRETQIFYPDAVITRAELTKMVLLTAGLQPKSLPAYGFDDLDFDAWYYPYVTKAHQVGLVTGYGDGNFRPDQAITRAEAVSILIRAFHAGSSFNGENPYEDVNTQDWFFNNVLLASQDGLIVGRSLGSFEPFGVLTRAEAVILIRRAQYAYAQL